MDELAGRGVELVRPPTREPWGLIEAWIDDPDGLRIHLVEVPADHPLRRDQRSLTTQGDRRERTDPRVEGIDHVQLAMPPGPEAEARAEAFFAGLLGLPRVPKPPELAARGGCWFERGPVKIAPRGGRGLPSGPQGPSRPCWSPTSMHCAGSSTAPAHPTRRAEDVPGRPQWYVDDPFGNRIELLPDR